MSATAPIKETRWIDAWIRWERDGDASDDDDDDSGLGDPQPAPVDLDFSFGGFSVRLKGYNSDSEAVWNSTGLTMWRSADILCDYLTTNQDLLKGKTILELGSGLGLVGIVASMLLKDDDDSKVVLTDGDTDVLAQLRLNVAANSLQLPCYQLRWGKMTASSFQEQQNAKFNVLLGSDLVYVSAVLVPLFETVSQLLTSDGIFVMAYCARRTADETKQVSLEDIFDEATRAGLSHECLRQQDDIYVHSFRWT